jgi:hypothetical protein
MCRPRAVPDHLGPLGAIRERPRSVDRGSWTPIVGTFTLEDRQCGLRTGHGITRNLAQFIHAEFDYQILISHTFDRIVEPTVETFGDIDRPLRQNLQTMNRIARQ